MRDILIVEDSSIVRLQLSEGLRKAGYKVLEAESGEAGLKFLKSNSNIGLVISDFHLGTLDGLTMLEKAVSPSGSRTFKSLMLTTEASDKMRFRARNIGVSAWIIKPVDMESLLEAVKELIAKT